MPRLVSLWLAPLALLLALQAAAPALADVRLGALAAGGPQPTAEGLSPGLRVEYAHAYFNHIDEMGGWERTVPGTPVLQLATKADPGPVLTSKESEGVGAMMSGYLHLAQAGTYRFKVNSNDGVRIRLGDKLLYEDPFRHAARMSDDLVLEVPQAGWYPLKVTFYQAKGDWTLELFWQPPDGKELAHVPAAAFAHPANDLPVDPVEAARREAARILEAARKEAAAIVEAAHKEAAAIAARAKN